MTATPRALAALLSYPTADLIAALPEIEAILADSPAKAGLRELVASLRDTDLLDAQERYVQLFDRTRSLSLHLFEHVHGDGRERGPAMVELNGIYAAAGLMPDTHELPDYLPMLLEFCSVDAEQGRMLLRNAAPVIDLIHGRLVAHGSPYAAVLRSALLFCDIQPSKRKQAAEPRETHEEIDRNWEEAAVLFGPGADPKAECGADMLAAKMRAAARTPNPTPRRPILRRIATVSQG